MAIYRPTYTENDLKVYLAARRRKKARVLELARETKLAKSTVQGALSRLANTGLVSRVTIHGMSFIRANSPTNRLRSLLAERRRLAERHAAQDKLLLQDIRFLQQAGPTSRRKTARSTKRSRK
ncbi:MAG: helix-turn-helix domain-containing protein [Planctomycetota bacterium]|nr:helix-turn-helix domain-containing protein [Planctomycetota bacterium]